MNYETLRRLKESGVRLAGLIGHNAPSSIVVQECGLMLRTMASYVGPDTIRTWLDEWMEMLIAGMELVGGGAECGTCRGIGRMITADGRNPQCETCRGVGRV